MKTWRLFRTARVVGMLCFLFFPALACSQDEAPLAAPPMSLQPSAEEKLFFDAANRERLAAGLRPLKWDDALASAARRHASLMASRADLSHQLPGEPPLDQRAGQAGARFSQVGENIAVGPEAPPIHEGWMKSPGHRANILDIHFTALGVGVVEYQGELYSVEDFSVAVANLSIEAQEEKVAKLLAAKGLRVTKDRAEARRQCSDELAPAGHQKMAIFRYEAPEISKLPEEMERKIRDGQYRQAAVGACEPKNKGSAIARFRLSVLLY